MIEMYLSFAMMIIEPFMVVFTFVLVFDFVYKFIIES